MLERRYGQWAGNEAGTREDPKRCIAEVVPKGWLIGKQCNNRRGHGCGGLFCKTHAKAMDRGVYVHAPEKVEVQK